MICSLSMICNASPVSYVCEGYGLKVQIDGVDQGAAQVSQGLVQILKGKANLYVNQNSASTSFTVDLTPKAKFAGITSIDVVDTASADGPMFEANLNISPAKTVLALNSGNFINDPGPRDPNADGEIRTLSIDCITK